MNSKLPPREGFVCGCGQTPDLASGAWRWTGTTWEHHHGYPVGYVACSPPPPTQNGGADCWSPDEERYFDGLGEAIDIYLEQCFEPVGAGSILKLWKGRKVKLTAEMLLPYPHDLIFEAMRELAYEHVGESADQWGGLAQKTQDRFDREFREWIWRWMTENDCLPECWSVADVKPCDVRVLEMSEYGEVKAAEEVVG